MVKRKLEVWKGVAAAAAAEQADLPSRRLIHFELGRCRLEMLDYKMKIFERSAGWQVN